MKILRKVALYFLLSITALMLVTGILVYAFQDKIIAIFVEQANQKLNTPVQVGKISVSIWEKFPSLAINLHNVVVLEGVQDSKQPLAKLQNIYFTFSIFGFLKGDYIVNQVHLENGEVFLHVFEDGDNNFTILKKGSSGGTEEVAFDISKIELKNVLCNYTDTRSNQFHSLLAKDLGAQLKIRDDLYYIRAKGELASKTIRIKDDDYFENKNLHINTDLLYDDANKFLTIEPSELHVQKSAFDIAGTYSIANDEINMLVNGKDTDIQTIFSLLPDRFYDNFKNYKSKGEVYFKGEVAGKMSGSESPEVNIDFGCKNASFFHPKYKKKLEEVFLEGNFHASKAEDLKTAKLELQNISGKLDEREIQGNFYLSNFDDYFLKFDFRAALDVQSALQFYPIERIRDASGLINMKVNFQGRVKDLQDERTTPRVLTTGEIYVQNLNFLLKKSNLPFSGFNGNFIFKNTDLAITDFQGEIGHSQFLLNGYFRNIVSFILFQDQPISIQADLASSHIDVDELLSGNLSNSSTGTTVSNQEYSFTISPKLQLTFNCAVNSLVFQRFKGRNIKGKLIVKNQLATLKDMTTSAAGGKMIFTGNVDARVKDKIEVITNTSYEGINIDSIFYIFKNFNQTFLVDKHLKGQIYADVSTRMRFNQKLAFDFDSFVADVGLSIKNGELNNFEPLQKLSRFIDEESLSRLKFSDLKNEIHIERQTIFLPDMEVKSNVSSIRLNGTHSFNQHINYHLRVPLKNHRKKDKDEAFGAIEEDNTGQPNLFLTIAGTTSDYKIGYDTRAAKLKMRQDIKKEGQEFKQVFKKDSDSPKKPKELNEDEYFDF